MLERPLEFNGLLMHLTRGRDFGIDYGKAPDPGDPPDPPSTGLLGNDPAPTRPSTAWPGTAAAQFGVWWVEIVTIDGLWDADIVDERFPIPAQSGERSGDDFYSGKTITINAIIHARTPDGLRSGQRAVQAAFADIDIHPLYMRSWVDANRLYVNCRKIQPLAMTEGIPSVAKPWERAFTVAVRADDPRIYSTVEQANQLIGAGSGSGGTTGVHLRDYPLPDVDGVILTLGGTNNVHFRSYPLPADASPGAGYKREYALLPIDGGGTSLGVVNGGTQETYPVTILYGPMTNPVYTNESTGQEMVWTDLDLLAGDYLKIDHASGEVLLNGSTLFESGLDLVNTDFWPLISGANVVGLIPFSAGPGAGAVIYWRDAF